MLIFGESYVCKFVVEGSWVPDPEGEKKHGRKTGAFPMKDIDMEATFAAMVHPTDIWNGGLE